MQTIEEVSDFIKRSKAVLGDSRALLDQVGRLYHDELEAFVEGLVIAITPLVADLVSIPKEPTNLEPLTGGKRGITLCYSRRDDKEVTLYLVNRPTELGDRDQVVDFVEVFFEEGVQVHAHWVDSVYVAQNWNVRAVVESLFSCIYSNVNGLWKRSAELVEMTARLRATRRMIWGDAITQKPKDATQ